MSEESSKKMIIADNDEICTVTCLLEEGDVPQMVISIERRDEQGTLGDFRAVIGTVADMHLLRDMLDEALGKGAVE